MENATDLPTASTHPSLIKIRPPTGVWSGLKLRELWAYRELLYFLVWKEIKVRYQQTILGASWAIIQPFFLMVIFSLFFGRLARMPSDGVPYPVWSYAALIPWTLFVNGVTTSSESIVSNARLITRVYFPRLAIPIAAVLGGTVDFAVAFLLLIVMMIFYGIVPTAAILWLPLLILLAIVTAVGVGLWLSAINAKYRDVRYVVPFMTQAWLFITPIVYPSSELPQPWRTLYSINPMAGVVEGFRWALLDTNTSPGPMIGVSAAAAVALLVGGAFYFRRMERTFADVV